MLTIWIKDITLKGEETAAVMLVFPVPGRMTNTYVCAWRDAVFNLKITTRTIGYHKTVQVVRGEVGQ